MTTLNLENSVGRSPLRRAFLLIPLVLAGFALSPTTQAQLPSPAPDGGYPGGNTAEGFSALQSLTSGVHNTALGGGALSSNTTGFSNTATGAGALLRNITGHDNTANGLGALEVNTGSDNTAVGSVALFSNTTGNNNTATGFEALASNTTGARNTANGFEALERNTTGADNTATGFEALFSNTTANFNTATGFQALFRNNTGTNNTATGFDALLNNTTGNNNTATGFQALENNTTIGGVGGLDNTAIGFIALKNNTIGESNTALGFQALFRNTSGGFNVALGALAGNNLTTGSNNIDISNSGVAGDNNTIRIGNTNQTRTFIVGIRGRTTGSANAVPVLIDGSGQLGTASSSRRFKKEIKPMDQTSDAILALKPVTFQYKSDSTGTPQFGLIAEEVAAVNPDLVVRDEKGEIYTVRYEAVNAMLLNEFLKEHRKVEALQASFTQQQKDFQATVVQLTARLNEQAAQIQKVSTQVAIQKSAPQMVVNDQ